MERGNDDSIDTPEEPQNIYGWIASSFDWAHCAPGRSAATDPGYGAVNFLNREVDSKLTIGFRSDRLNDNATKYFGSTVMIRPEIRFDHS